MGDEAYTDLLTDVMKLVEDGCDLIREMFCHKDRLPTVEVMGQRGKE